MPRNQPCEIYAEPTWEIFDPNTARVIAVFSSQSHAADYLNWLNTKESDAHAQRPQV